MNTLWQDLRYAVRVLFKSRGLTTIALLTLALGIGVNSAIFSVVNAIVLRPLPYPNSEQLMVIWGNLHKTGLEEIEISALEFKDFQEQCQAFDQIAAYTTQGLNLTGVDQPERLRGAAISANLFPTLGIQPRVGRNFAAEEDRYGNDTRVILSHSLWQRRFAGDPSVVNKTIQLDGRTVVIVGVMPADFHFPDRDTEAWIPPRRWLWCSPQSASTASWHLQWSNGHMRLACAWPWAQARAMFCSWLCAMVSSWRWSGSLWACCRRSLRRECFPLCFTASAQQIRRYS